MSRRSVAVVVVMVLALGIVAAGAASAQESPSATVSVAPSSTAPTSNSGKVTFTMGTLGDMNTANPFKYCCSQEYEMMLLAYDRLFNLDQATMQPVSDLAYYPPQMSADGKTWTFKIRSGVKWSDGVPLTAHDVAFTLNLINDKDLSAFKDYLGFPIPHNAFEAPDDTTLIWHMQTPTLSPLAPPLMPILPEHIWSRFENTDTKTLKEFRNVPAVGSGPFVLTDWKEGQYWTLERNPNYWGPAPHIDEVMFKVYGNPEALKLALENGEVDAAEALPPSIFDSLQNVSNITTNISPGTYFDNLAFNFEGTANPALHDLRVREAIEYSIDKQALVDRVLMGYGSVGDSVILPEFPRWRWTPTADEVIGYDPAKAKELLAEAGYTDTNGDGFVENSAGQTLQMQVLTITDLTYSVAEGKLIVGWMNDVGIKTSIKTVSEGKAYDLWAQHDFDMYVWGWGEDPDPDSMYSAFQSNQCGYWSDGCWKDPKFDQMYMEQKTTIDPAKRKQISDQIQQYLYEQIPEIVLLYESDLQAYRNDRFTGFLRQPASSGGIYYVYGPYSYLNIRPVGQEASGGAKGGGVSPVVWLAIAVVLLVVVGGVTVSRRGKHAEDTE